MRKAGVAIGGWDWEPAVPISELLVEIGSVGGEVMVARESPTEARERVCYRKTKYIKRELKDVSVSREWTVRFKSVTVKIKRIINVNKKVD